LYRCSQKVQHFARVELVLPHLMTHNFTASYRLFVCPFTEAVFTHDSCFWQTTNNYSQDNPKE